MLHVKAWSWGVLGADQVKGTTGYMSSLQGTCSQHHPSWLSPESHGHCSHLSWRTQGPQPPGHLHGGQRGAALGDLLGITVRGLLDLQQPGHLRKRLQGVLGCAGLQVLVFQPLLQVADVASVGQPRGSRHSGQGWPPESCRTAGSQSLGTGPAVPMCSLG